MANCLLWCDKDGCGFCPVQCARDFLCYDDSTTMKTKNGLKKIKEIKEGEDVLTLRNGEEHWSQVTLNMNIPVTASGTYIQAVDPVNGEKYEIHVTDSHNVPIIVSDSGLLNNDASLRGASTGKDSFEVQSEVVSASNVEVGASIQVISARKNHVSLATVTAVQSRSLDSKNVLYTTDGTVLSNGVLTAAACDLPIKGQSLKDHIEKSTKETEFNRCLEDSILETNILTTLEKASAIGMDNGDVYATDLYVYFLKHCGGITDIMPGLLHVLDEKISPTSLDVASVLQRVIEKEFNLFDTNGDGVLDHTENPLLPVGKTQKAVDKNPYLCEKCKDPIDQSKFRPITQTTS